MTTPTSSLFKCCNSFELHFPPYVNELDSLSHLELNSRCPGDEALEKMGIFGTKTSESCLLEGPSVGGCLQYLTVTLSFANIVSNEIAQSLALMSCVFPLHGVRGIG